ncbi:BatD family protein [Flavihumibacter rivuli]|uniref:BatD family protein n=1 Tax=Flavihumibacter rivuli TaxID=2838156 RepID=UPI001BDE8E6B|nr:BatD family protein [Flavihumibacter rivuli]ULQ55015.1 BatD family protein [Flavihumibacter rivuli]
MVQSKKRIYAGWLLLMLAIGLNTFAQQMGVKADINRNKILIGEQVILQLQAEVPAGAEVRWFPVDSFPHFDIIDAGKIDTLSMGQSTSFKQLITLTSFDSGTQVIPRLPIIVNNNRYLSDSLQVEVGFSPVPAEQPYHDIKDIIEVQEVEPLYLNYILVVATILAILALVYLLRKRKKKPAGAVDQQVRRLSAFERAMESLGLLKTMVSGAGGKEKEYYVGLNDTLRSYLMDKGLLSSPDSTNEQLVVKLRGQLDKDGVYRLAQTLRLADAVKFAKFIPTSPEHEEAYAVIEKTIRFIEETSQRKPEA